MSLKDKITGFDIKNSRWLTVEFFRTIPLIIACILMFAPDWESLLVVKFVFGFLFALALISHFIRKVLFPYLSLKDYAVKALENPISSGMVFLGFCLIICVTFMTGAQFFR
jgi:hypothetical protein